jgi:hypothetical protein
VSDGKCGTCAFMFQTHEDRRVCRRYPPATFVDPPSKERPGGSITTHFPPVGPNMACGEYKSVKKSYGFLGRFFTSRDSA